MRRTIVALAALAVLAGTTPGDGTAKTWCGLYCDVVEAGCRKTIGWLDQEACSEWHQGCLDGCQVDG